MGIDEGDLQVIDVDMILENCPITIIILDLLLYSTIQCSTKVIILYDSKCDRTIPQYIMSCSVVHKNVIMMLSDWQSNATFSFYNSPRSIGDFIYYVIYMFSVRVCISLYVLDL